MFGAIIGDIAGSRFEFDNCKSKEFELFTNTCDFTDDTVMTLAVAKALLPYEAITDMDAFKRELVRVMHEVGMPHPHCGYGGRFCTWMISSLTAAMATALPCGCPRWRGLPVLWASVKGWRRPLPK